ncbi:hypothetical protein CASFOL_031851 [Castilleja foliolosa]|uniref:Putative plant transposon protein domain-containing protein n=1 Tax=Castilleja foliolosa TaxID=1961234 RepID=A0ABD3C2F6_9LAMI
MLTTENANSYVNDMNVAAAQTVGNSLLKNRQIPMEFSIGKIDIFVGKMNTDGITDGNILPVKAPPVNFADGIIPSANFTDKIAVGYMHRPILSRFHRPLTYLPMEMSIGIADGNISIGNTDGYCRRHCQSVADGIIHRVMADNSKSSGKKPIPSYKAMSLQEEHQMLSTSRSTSSGSRARDPAPAPSLAAVEAQTIPFAQLFPGQPGNPIDADHPPALIPTSVLAEMINRPMPTKRSRRLCNIPPGDIPPAIPRSQSGPRRPTPLERMNLVDEETRQSDSDDEDYLPSDSSKASSFLPDLTPEEIESIAAAVTPPVAEEVTATDDFQAPADNLAIVVFKATPSATSSPPPSDAHETPAPSSPTIPHTDFFSEENSAPSHSFACASASPSDNSSDWDDSLANYVRKQRTKGNKSHSEEVSVDEVTDPVAGDAANTGDSRISSFEEADAAEILTSMPTKQSPPLEDLDRMIDEYEDLVPDMNDVDIATFVPHSTKFLTAEAESRFDALKKRSMIDERRIMVDVFKKHNLVDFFEARGMLATVSTAVPFVRDIIVEFYANLVPQVCEKGSASYGKVYVRGNIYTFTPEKINLLMGTDDYQGTSAVDNMDEAITFLTRGKVSKWEEQLSAAKLTSLYSVLHKIAVFNWLPSKNTTVITRPQAQLLYRLGTGIKFNFGQMVFDCVTKLAQPNSGSSLVFPSIIYNLLESQTFDAWGSDDFTGDAAFFTIRTHLLRGDRFVDLPWIDRRSNVFEGGVGSSADNMASNTCHFSRTEVENHILRLEAQIVQLDAQKKDIQLMVDALKASLLTSGQGGDEAKDEAEDAGNTSEDEETETDEDLEAATLRARKGKGKVQEKGKGKLAAAEEETPLRRSLRRRRN